MSTSRNLIFGVLVLVGSAAIAAPAPTVSEAQRAKELFTKGTAHFNLGRFKEAAEEYKECYEIHNDPVILYNVAQAYRLAGSGFEEKALFFYKSFRSQVPKASNRAEVEERITSLERILAEQKRATERAPNTTVPLDQPAVVEIQPATTTTVTAAPLKPTPVYKKWWLWTVVGVAAVGVGVGLGVGLTLGAPRAFTPNFPDGGKGAALSVGVSF